MLRAPALLSLLIAVPGAALAQDAKPDTVQVHGKSLVLSCSEWKRNPDGSWGNISPLLVGDKPVNEVTLRGRDTKVLEDKCGNGAAASAPPQPAAAPVRHAAHKHAPQGASNGGT